MSQPTPLFCKCFSYIRNSFASKQRALGSLPGKGSTGNSSITSFAATLLISLKPRDWQKPNGLLTKDKLQSSSCAGPACGLAPGTSNISLQIKQPACAVCTPCTPGTYCALWREGWPPMKGSHRHQLVLALAEGGGLSMPTRLGARVLAAGLPPQKWPPAKSRERKDLHFGRACCPHLFPHGVHTPPPPTLRPVVRAEGGAGEAAPWLWLWAAAGAASTGLCPTWTRKAQAGGEAKSRTLSIVL